MATEIHDSSSTSAALLPQKISNFSPNQRDCICVISFLRRFRNVPICIQYTVKSSKNQTVPRLKFHILNIKICILKREKKNVNTQCLYYCCFLAIYLSFLQYVILRSVDIICLIRQVMELLVHLNKRIKSRPKIQLPVETLLVQYQDPAAVSFVTV